MIFFFFFKIKNFIDSVTEVKGIYFSLFGLSLVNIFQFLVDLDLFPHGLWLILIKLIGFLFVFCGGLISYAQGLTKEIFIQESDYDQNLEGYLIEYKKFHKKTPIVRVFMKNDNGFEEIIVGVEYRGKDIFIGSNISFNGKLIIK